MIPVKLKLVNFTSYGRDVPELDFSKLHLAAISGPNGAGKSSLLDAITWCLWGWSRAGDSSDSLIRLGANEMWVEFSFALDQDTFTVRRRRSLKRGGSTALELWSNSHNLTEGTIKTTQEKIINLLHLGYETFTNSSFLRQGHADEFTTKGPTDRKRILADILGLSHYDELEGRAKEKVKEIQNKLQLLEYQLLEIDTELSLKEGREKELEVAKAKVSETELHLKSLEDELKILQKEKETVLLTLEQQDKLLKNLTAQKEELAEVLRQGKEQAERIKNLQLRIKGSENLDQKIIRLKEAQKQLEDLRSQNQKKLELEKALLDANGKLSLKLQQKSQLEEEIKKLEQNLKEVGKEGARCPTCGQEIGKDKKHDVKLKLKNQKMQLQEEIKKIQTTAEEEEIKRLEETLKDLRVDSIKLEELQNSLKQMEVLQARWEQVLQDQAALATEQKNLDSLRGLYKSKNQNVKKLEEEFASLPKVPGDQNMIFLKIQTKEKQLEALRSEEKAARDLLGRAKELVSRAEQLEKVYAHKSKEKARLQKEKQIFEELTLAFGKKGIQAMIIETAIPEIEDEANRLLDRLTDGRMKVHFETQRETKTKLESGEKGIIETLDIIISDEMGERPYDLYSGGEAFRVNFAIRLAISKLLTRRAGAKLQFLVIDEGFGTQDQEGRSRIVEVLDAIKNDFEKILVITHLEELKEEFPVRIEVSKNSQGSTFEVVGI